MDPETLKQYVDVLRYALDSLWPYIVALGIVAPLANKRVRNATGDRLAKTIQPKNPTES